MSTSSLVIPDGLPQEVAKWSKTHVQNFLEANKAEYYIEDDDIKTLEQKKVTGGILLGLTSKRLENYGLVEGAADLIVMIVEQLKVVKEIVQLPTAKAERKRPKEGRSDEEQSSEDTEQAKRRKLNDEQERVVQYTRGGPAPSSEARHGEFLRKQEKRGDILNGRGVSHKDNTGLPVCLYSEAFADFEAAIINQEFEPTAEQYSLTERLFGVASKLYPLKKDREEAVKPLLEQLIGSVFYEVPSMRDAQSDTALRTQCQGDLMAARVLMEMKNEIGTGGSDPSIQGACSYKFYWSDDRADRLRKSCCCPTFIIAIAGPWMCILGGVFVGKVVVQPLTDYIWLGNGTHLEHRLTFVTKVFRALSEGQRTLDNYYKRLQLVPQPVERFYPYPRAFGDPQALDNIVYIKELVEGNPSKAIFKARVVSSGQEVVVKFVQRYNLTAHRLLASHDLAPKLLHPLDDNPLLGGRLQMIVMEFVGGKIAHEVYGVSDDVIDEIKRAINILHHAGLVFGDLRTPNIMLTNNKPLLFDFDWCAEDGVGTYPKSLNDVGGIEWHQDVKRGGKMKKEHDLFMLEKLCKALCTVN
ncbi:hypothetical protein FRC02_000818 [Tulasnella sp. 418]|nr:hypothetical protein FRC02_000818 [Tulasnella sp. 418]